MAGGPVSDTFKLAYQRYVELAVQQKKSRFEMGFSYKPDLRGRAIQILDLVEPTTAIVNGVRGGDTPNIATNHQPVWIQPIQIEWGTLIEPEDEIKAFTDYESPYIQNAAAALVRARDNVFANALSGPRLVGVDSATSANYAVPETTVTNGIVLNTVGSIDGATPSGMNIRKLQRAKRILKQRYVETDYEELWWCGNAQQMEELFNDIITINTDERKMAYLDEDKRTVQRVAGVNCVSYESLPLPATVTGIANFAGDTTDYLSMFWCKSGMHYGDFYPLTTTADRNPQKKYRINPYLENWFGATRSEDAKMVLIATAINPAGPNG